MDQKSNFRESNLFKNPAHIVQNFGAVMARSNLAVVQVKIRPALGFFTTTLDQSHRSQAQQGRPLVAHDPTQLVGYLDCRTARLSTTNTSCWATCFSPSSLAARA